MEFFMWLYDTAVLQTLSLFQICSNVVFLYAVFTPLISYLELADWVLKDAIESCREDHDWEDEIDVATLKSGQIRMTLNKGIFCAQGAGLPKKVDDKHIIKTKEAIPEIASKSVKAKDVYAAAYEHLEYGLELKDLSQPLLSKD
jgi:hypothetical protein